VLTVGRQQGVMGSPQTTIRWFAPKIVDRRSTLIVLLVASPFPWPRPFRGLALSVASPFPWPRPFRGLNVYRGQCLPGIGDRNHPLRGLDLSS
jgi:hypothetical protein